MNRKNAYIVLSVFIFSIIVCSIDAFIHPNYFVKIPISHRWIIEDGCIKINGSGTGEGQSAEGGDLIFAHKFKNFEVRGNYFKKLIMELK